MATYPFNTLPSYNDQEPNHMIFWLDRHIGNPREYVRLKKAFGSNTDPRCETWTMLTDKDYDDILVAGDAITVTFGGVVFLLQAFDNEDSCLDAFEKNQDKRIFFITSGSLGRSAVPKIIERYSHVFTDPNTRKPYPSVYVLCCDIAFHLQWAMEYVGYIQIFNFDTELLERITRDIAEYYIDRGERIRQANDLRGAFQYLAWAQRLCFQYDKMQQNISMDDLRPVNESKRMREINKLIEEIKTELSEELIDDDGASSDGDTVIDDGASSNGDAIIDNDAYSSESCNKHIKLES